MMNTRRDQILVLASGVRRLFRLRSRAGAATLIRTSISEKYDFSTKITTQMQLAVTSQSNCVVIFVANWIGDL